MDDVLEMRSDAELLNRLCDEDLVIQDRCTGRRVVLSRKLIAEWTGYSIQAVSDFGTGKTRIPPTFWRDVLRHHMDARVVQLFMPEDYSWQVMDLRGAPVDVSRNFFRDAVEEMGQYHEQQRYLAEILADGRVDELDAATVQAYDDAYLSRHLSSARLHRAILTAFSRARQTRESAT